MNAIKSDNDYDVGYLNFQPYRIELQGSCEVKINLTDSEIQSQSPDEETLSEMQSRADTLDEIFKQQSAAAQGFVERIKKNLAFGIPATMEKVVQLQDAILCMDQTQRLTRLVRKELAEKYEDELKEVKNGS